MVLKMFSSTQNRMQESIDNSSLIWVGSKFAHSKVKTAFTTVRFTLDACSFHMKYFSLQHYKRLSKNMAWPSLLKVLSFLLKSNLCLCPFKVSPSLKEALNINLNLKNRYRLDNIVGILNGFSVQSCLDKLATRFQRDLVIGMSRDL